MPCWLTRQLAQSGPDQLADWLGRHVRPGGRRIRAPASYRTPKLTNLKTLLIWIDLCQTKSFSSGSPGGPILRLACSSTQGSNCAAAELADGAAGLEGCPTSGASWPSRSAAPSASGGGRSSRAEGTTLEINEGEPCNWGGPSCIDDSAMLRCVEGYWAAQSCADYCADLGAGVGSSGCDVEIGTSSPLQHPPRRSSREGPLRDPR